MSVSLNRWSAHPYFFINGDLDFRVIKSLTREMSFFVEGFERTKKYKEGRWDGRECLLYKSKKGVYYFPCGMIDVAKRIFSDFEVEYFIQDIKLDDVKKRYKSLDLTWTGHCLRDYQTKAVVDIKTNDGGTICLPTGAGKTLIMLRLAFEYNLPFLVIVHTKELMYQWEKNIKTYFNGRCPGLVGDGYCSFDPITIAMMQTLSQKIVKDKMENLDYPILMIDECFPYDTLVQTEIGAVPIGHIVRNRIRVRVLTHTGEYKWVVGWYEKPLVKNMVRVMHECGSFECTEDHKILTDTGFVCAKDLICGSVITKHCEARFETVRVRSVEIIEIKEYCKNATSGVSQLTVFDLTVEDNHTYTANGIVVSNCHRAPADTAYMIAMHCFPYETRVQTDRGTMCIGDIVENKLPVKVLTHRGHYKQATAWKKIPLSTHMVNIIHDCGSFQCTPDHNILTAGGWKPAIELCVGDDIYYGLDNTGEREFCRNTKDASGESRNMEPDQRCELQERIFIAKCDNADNHSGTVDIGRSPRGSEYNAEIKKPAYPDMSLYKPVGIRVVEVFDAQKLNFVGTSRIKSNGVRCHAGDCRIRYMQHTFGLSKTNVGSEVTDPQHKCGSVGKICGSEVQDDADYWERKCPEIGIDQRAVCDFSNEVQDQCYVYDITVEDDHTYTANGVIVSNCNAPVRIGASATPVRTDGADIKIWAACGEIKTTITADELIKRGILARPEFLFMTPPPVHCGKGSHYSDVYLQGIVINEGRNDMIIKKANDLAAQDLIVYVHVERIDHGEMLKERIPGSVFLSGKDGTTVRQGVLKKFAKGEIKVLISTLLKEGVDIPSMNAFIAAGAGKSPIGVLQKAGRALRIAPGKTSAIIVDFRDSGKYLGDHWSERYNIYKTTFGDYCP